MSRQIVKEVIVRATPEDVWRALTDGEELKRWFPVDARVDPGPGGSIWISWGSGVEGTAPITGWDPPRHFQWTEDRGPVKLAVDFHVEALAGGTTRVRLVQSGFGAGPEWDDEFHMTDGGWTYFMAHLKWYLERHRGVPRQVTSFREPASYSREESFDRLKRAMAAIGSAPLVESPTLLHLGLRIPSLNDAVVLIEIEPHENGSRPALWLSTYGLSPDALSAARERFGALYRRALE